MKITLTRASIIQFLKYSLGGFLYFWTAWVIITFGSSYIGLWWANIIGNGAGIVINYLVQQFFTFETGKKNITHSSWRFIFITIVNLLLSYILLKTLTERINIPLWLAQFFSAAFFTVWNWFWYKYWVFKGKNS